MTSEKGYLVFDIETAPEKYDEYRSTFPMSKKKPAAYQRPHDTIKYEKKSNILVIGILFMSMKLIIMASLSRCYFCFQNFSRPFD